ncbi:probable RNA polymerase II nuclear localization protein SLC7A6OS isoform X2 [Varanus komodoensis]|uniref:probable RNA polymerase II nuclear localization protein SLC7A6OS isoform X2 n=1 Tax=Varanus komodoensis TaxID=61221 RepID=UPI001CF76D58|nr:probable RNA polymerase II nuclear localization protein SLC7A6OS isoform X2 [Varanus komodoensis]
MERAAVLRVKRKCDGAAPVDALVLACKRLRTEQDGATATATASSSAGKDEVQTNLFKLVATVASENEPVQKYIQEALTKNKAVQLLRPSIASAQRVIQDLRSSKQAVRQESRYRLVASHRPNLHDSESAVLDENGTELNDSAQLVPGAKKDASQKESGGTSVSCGEFQLLDIVQEEDVGKDALQGDPDVILCNAVEMIRERLTVSDSKEAEHSSKEEEYVYDIYYMETASPGWIENILSVRPYTQDCELVDEYDVSEEIYEDEDDENHENNWRNDYPDEDEFSTDEDDESENGSVSDEDSGHIKRTWEKYRSDVLKEFEYDELQELDSE